MRRLNISSLLFDSATICVFRSHWKNPKGYTIALDKRLAADGHGLQQTTVNENFAKFAESLQLAARTAREGVEARSDM